MPTEPEKKARRDFSKPDFSLEEQLETAGTATFIAGVDEAGRGPWAGPVVAAAVIFDRSRLPTAFMQRINDSKKLSARQREALYPALTAGAETGVGQASVLEIDRMNILQATLLAMDRAIAALPRRPDACLIDGRQVPSLAVSLGTGSPDGALPSASQPLSPLLSPPPSPPPSITLHSVIKGDSRSLSIAAASILAKVTRDRLMAELAGRWPGYGWERNAGYGTAEHREALARLGPTPEHRRSFKPVATLEQEWRQQGK